MKLYFEGEKWPGPGLCAGIEDPPKEFTMTVLDIDPNFDFKNWEDSKEWKLFTSGRASGVTSVTNEVLKVISRC